MVEGRYAIERLRRADVAVFPSDQAADGSDLRQLRFTACFPILSVFDIAQMEPIRGAEQMPKSPTRRLVGDNDHGVTAPLISYLESLV